MRVSPTYTYTYRQIEEIISPMGFSVRVMGEPLYLHRFGFPLKKFIDKMSLAKYLNDYMLTNYS